MRGLLRASSVGTIWLCALIVVVYAATEPHLIDWWNIGMLAAGVVVFGLTFVGRR